MRSHLINLARGRMNLHILSTTGIEEAVKAVGDSRFRADLGLARDLLLKRWEQLTGRPPSTSTEQFNNIPATVETQMADGNTMLVLQEEDSLTTGKILDTSTSSSVEDSPAKAWEQEQLIRDVELVRDKLERG